MVTINTNFAVTSKTVASGHSRRLVSAEYFGCLLIKRFIFVYVFFERKFETLISLFLTARLTHRKKNHKLPGRVTFWRACQEPFD